MNGDDSRPRFLCDAMLGSLCRWLRFFGFDCEYSGVEADDCEIGARAEIEGRWLLTADRDLASKGPRSMLVRSKDLEDQLVEVLQRLRLRVQAELQHSRCSACNGRLEEQPRDWLVDEVPPYVIRTASHFAKCTRCGQVFWPGTHSERILNRMRRVVGRLD